MEESLHPPDDLDEPLPPELQALLDQFKDYAVWHPRLVQVQTHLLHTIWEPADVAHVVVCGPSGVGKSKLAEVLVGLPPLLTLAGSPMDGQSKTGKA
jgi:putative ribosome biogenesis GTPase RsgA